MSRPQQEDWRGEAARRHKEKIASQRFKLAEGDNSIRILPRKQKDGRFVGPPWQEFLQHQKVGPKERYVACGKDFKTGQGKCLICDKILPGLRESQKKSLRARALILEPKLQFAMQIAFLDDQGNFAGPTLWVSASGGSRTLSTQVLGVLKSPRRDFVSLSKGYNINIERTGTTFKDTKYGSIIPDTDPTEVPKAIVAKMKTFAELITPYSEEEQRTAYYGEETEEEESTADTDETEVGSGEEERSWDEEQTPTDNEEGTGEELEDEGQSEPEVEEESSEVEENLGEVEETDQFASIFDDLPTGEEEDEAPVPPSKRQPQPPAKKAPTPPAKAPVNNKKPATPTQQRPATKAAAAPTKRK